MGRRPGSANHGAVEESVSRAPGPPVSEEIAVCLAYVQEAATCLEAEAEDDATRSIAAEVHLYSQSIFHETENRAQTDYRGGVRVDQPLASLIAAVSAGTTSCRSPTMP